MTVTVVMGLTACSRGAPLQVGGQLALPVTRAQVGAVVLTVELARTADQRSAGLRGRQVPPGTGMAFDYRGGQLVRFTMSEVSTQLVAVFVRSGLAVSVEQLAPCAGSVAQCPTYGPSEPVDLVVEAAPDSLPEARPGDRVTLR